MTWIECAHFFAVRCLFQNHNKNTANNLCVCARVPVSFLFVLICLQIIKTIEFVVIHSSNATNRTCVIMPARKLYVFLLNIPRWACERTTKLWWWWWWRPWFSFSPFSFFFWHFCQQLNYKKNFIDSIFGTMV